jgi:dihydropteroate synthase
MMLAEDAAFGGPGRGDARTPPPRFSVPRREVWKIGNREMDLSRPRVMGILNLTPDSFSDGGELSSLETALSRARSMVEDGADILDVGGESTRPGASPVRSTDEIRRILPLVEAAASILPVPISVDTRKASVASAALRAGALVVNDVSGLGHDPEMAATVAEGGGSLVLSHMRGTPVTMREMAVYDDVVADVLDELERSLETARSAGIELDRIVIDPGIGFAKGANHSLRILKDLGRLRALGRPVLVGPSRKSFIGDITGAQPRERVPGTLAACVLSYLRGARIFRVHDVAPVVQALAVTRAIVEASE